MVAPVLVALLVSVPQARGEPRDRVVNLMFFGACIELPRPFENVPAAVRDRVEVWTSRCEAFRKRRPAPASDSLDGMVAYARWGYEGRLFAVAQTAAAESEAAQYVRALGPCYEWEGYHDCPEREAVFADAYLREHPGSPFVEYLPLLAAHRWQCAAEGYEYEARAHVRAAKGSVGLRAARRREHGDLEKALRSSDPLVRFAAAALARTQSCF